MVTHKLSRLALAAAITSLIALAGCEGGEGTTDFDSGSNASQQTATIAPSEPAGPLDALTSDLESAGLSTYPDEAGDAQTVITAGPTSEVRMIQIAYYDDPTKARKVWKEIEAINAEYPGQGLVSVNGHVLVRVNSEKPLTGAERAAFEKVVGIVEGNE